MYLVACGDAMDISRPVDAPKSLGTHLYEEVCQRIAYSDDPKDVSGQQTADACRRGSVLPSTAGPRLVALAQQRMRFITAVDTAVDPTMAGDLRTLLTRMLPLYDDGTMQAHMAALSEAVKAVAEAPDAVAALGRLAARRGYVQPRANFAQAWLSYPGLDQLTRTALKTPASRRADSWHLLLRSLAEQLGKQPQPFVAHKTGDMLALSQFLLSPLERNAHRAAPRWVVRRDVRGIAMPAMENNLPKAPFSDRDGDGLVDVDNQGRYLGIDGKVLNGLPTPFPVAQASDKVARTKRTRALRDDGALWYQYRDAAPTVLAGLLAQLKLLLAQNDDMVLSVAQALEASLGDKVTKQHTFDDYTTQAYGGFDAAASPYIDLVQSFSLMRQEPALLHAVQHVQLLWRKAEMQLASLATVAWQADTWRRESPQLYAPPLATDTPLAHDLLALLSRIAAVPELTHDLMLALADPETAPLGARLAEQMRYSDSIDFDPKDVNAPAQGAFQTPVDRHLADGWGNQSVFERLAHLVHDASGRRICSNAVEEPFPHYAPCELFEIEDAAVFYVRAMAGTATLTMRLRDDDFFFPEQLQEAAARDPGHSEMEAFTGIEGFEKIDTAQGLPAQYMTFRVTPEAAARLLFSMYDARVPADSLYGTTRAAAQMVTPRLHVDGVPFDVLHQGTLFAWEKNGFFQSLQPLLHAFSSHGREDLLVDLVSTLHLHWPTQQDPTTQSVHHEAASFAHQTGLSRLEPLFARLLDEGHLVERLGDLARASFALANDDGASGPRAIAASVEHALRTSHNADRWSLRRMTNGAPADSSLTTPAALFVRGLTDLRTNLATHLAHDSKAAKLTDKALHQMLDTQLGARGMQFTNRDVYALTDASLGFVINRLAHAHAAGTDAWATKAVVDDAIAVLDHASVQMMLQLASAMADDDALGVEVGALCSHLLDKRMDVTLEATTDILQILGDTQNITPLLHQASNWLAPDTGVISQSMHVLQALQDIDTVQTMPRLMQGLVRDMGDETPLSALLDIFGRVNRQAPGEEAALAAGDVHALLRVANHLIKSPEHGFMRLVQLVQGRHDGALDPH